MPNFDVLGSLVRDLHHSISQLFYVALPVAILISVITGFLKNGSPDYIDILRRALITSLLLVAFPEISNVILDVCDGVANKIDNLSGMDAFLRMAQEKSQSYALGKSAFLLKFDDLIIALLSFLSFIALYLARYVNIALYYFYWVLLSAISPILILFYMFPSTAGITRNLFRSLIEVASWKIIWAVQSAMLASLSLGNIYSVEGSYVTLVVLNFVIALGMFFTPLIVKSLVGEGVHATAQTLGPMAAAAAVAAPVKAVSAYRNTKQMIKETHAYALKGFRSAKQNIQPRR